ncbi:MAG: eight-cysteine-cluster domain-containing protein [bacterium]|nr:eight-cysteine-cluster domain-containing protein [bacterium]
MRWVLITLFLILITGCAEENIPDAECTTNDDCSTGGCSGEICGTSSTTGDVASICLWKEEYRCFKITGCECIEGHCQWKQTQEFLECVEDAKQSKEGPVV